MKKLSVFAVLVSTLASLSAYADNVAIVSNTQGQYQGQLGASGSNYLDTDAAAASSPGYGGTGYGYYYGFGGDGYAAADAAGSLIYVGDDVETGNVSQYQAQVQVQDGTAIAGNIVILP